MKSDYAIKNSVDCVFDVNGRYVLLAKRKKWPFEGYWALPGGRQEPFQKLQDALLNVIRQRLNMSVEPVPDKANTLKFADLKMEAQFHQIKTYDSGTDPRGGNTTVYAIQLNVDKNDLMRAVKPGDNFCELMLCDRLKLPKLAFDHSKFIDEYFNSLKPYTETKETYDAGKYRKPSVASDIAVFAIIDKKLKVLLVKRKAWPFKGLWALPGGFVQMDETLEFAAKRELFEETNVNDIYIEQLCTFGDPERDPRTRVISVAYFALIRPECQKLKATTDAAEVSWFDVDKTPKLAFDHKKILKHGLERLRAKLGHTTIAFRLLPEKFTLTDIQNIYEAITIKKIDKRNFRRKLLSLEIIEGVGERTKDVAHRPAKLYSLKKNIPEEIEML